MYVILHVIGLWVDTNSTPWNVAHLYVAIKFVTCKNFEILKKR
jgi:hypothetical protein